MGLIHQGVGSQHYLVYKYLSSENAIFIDAGKGSTVSDQTLTRFNTRIYKWRVR